MVGGMFTSTVLTLVVIPVPYYLWRRRESVETQDTWPLRSGWLIPATTGDFRSVIGDLRFFRTHVPVHKHSQGNPVDQMQDERSHRNPWGQR